MNCPPLKDWPAGATHYTAPLDDSGMWCAVFWRKEGEWFPEAWQVDDAGALKNVKSPTVMNDTLARMIPRPGAWTGEGLPPAETVCEVATRNDPEWLKVTIKYVGEERIIAQDDESERCWLIANCQFRPIRTPEQIAAEEKGRAVTDMLCIVSSSDLKGRGVTAQLEALYDANYRKQVAP